MHPWVGQILLNCDVLDCLDLSKSVFVRPTDMLAATLSTPSITPASLR